MDIAVVCVGRVPAMEDVSNLQDGWDKDSRNINADRESIGRMILDAPGRRLLVEKVWMGAVDAARSARDDGGQHEGTARLTRATARLMAHAADALTIMTCFDRKWAECPAIVWDK